MAIGCCTILTNLPLRKASAKRVARLYRKRWTLETAFQHLEAYFHSEINTLGYPKAALFGFCLALVAYNMLAVVMAALRSVHGAETIDQDLSLYYVANDIAQTYHGMMIAIPEDEWRVFSRMRPAEMVATLRELAQKVRLGRSISVAGRAGIATKIRYAFGIPRQGFQRRPIPDAMPSRQHTPR